MKQSKEKLELETLKTLTYTQINELLNKLTAENKKLREHTEELYELAYNNCRGLAHDELNEIVEKYEG